MTGESDLEYFINVTTCVSCRFSCRRYLPFFTSATQRGDHDAVRRIIGMYIHTVASATSGWGERGTLGLGMALCNSLLF